LEKEFGALLEGNFLVLEVNHPRSTIGFEATKASPNFK